MDDNKVAVLIENLMSQFRTFGEGLAGLSEKVDQGFNDLNNRVDKLESRMGKLEGKADQLLESNTRDHQQFMQALSELDTEMIQLKRVK